MSLQAELCGGNTNFNYKIYSTSQTTETNPLQQKSIFVKHVKGYSKCFGESAPISTNRLNYEYFGIKEFQKYGTIVSECYICDT